jgi:hypothetical protein
VTDFASGSDRIVFDRGSFGFSADAELEGLLDVGGAAPEQGEWLHVADDGYVLYDENWSTLAGQTIVAQLVGVRAADLDLNDFLLV